MTIYGKKQTFNELRSLTCAHRRHHFSNSEWFLILILPKKIKYLTFDNLEVFTVEQFWPDLWRSWARQLAGLGISLDPVDDQCCPCLGQKRCMSRACEPLALHCGSLVRPQLISKQWNIVSEQRNPSGKFYHPIPFIKLWLFPINHSGKMWEYFPCVCLLLEYYFGPSQSKNIWYSVKQFNLTYI